MFDTPVKIQAAGDYLRGRLHRLKMRRTYDELALEIGMGKQAIYWFAIGYKTPKVELLEKIEAWCDKQEGGVYGE